MTVLIIGNADDIHAVQVKIALEQTGAVAEYFDTALFPTQSKISLFPNTDEDFLTLSDGQELNLKEIQSVYWRTFSGVRVPTLEDVEQRRVAVNDSMSTLRSLMQSCPARWVNSWQAYQFHQEKPLQLRRARQIGVSIPATVITNDPQKVIEFYSECDRIIFKPVYGGSHTKFVTKEHLDLERLKFALSYSPVTLQEYIPGTNIRSYVIGENVYSAEICSPEIDFRLDLNAELRPQELPEAVKEQCLAITEGFGMEWTAIDWRLKPTGEYIFLEANFSPMFVYFEKQTGFPITEKLVELLLQD